MLDATLTTLRQRGSELIADAEDSHRHHFWERAIASAALAGAYFAAYAAMASSPENLTEIPCATCGGRPCTCRTTADGHAAHLAALWPDLDIFAARRPGPPAT